MLIKQNITKKIYIINGPNLGLLGRREPEIYGQSSLNEIIEYTNMKVETLLREGLSIEWFQSDIEGEIVSKIGSLIDLDYTALIINPAAYSHTSVAILDALKMVPFNIVEVHLSNTSAREEFRQKRITAIAADVVIEGAGKNSYFLAISSQLN